MIKRSKDAVLVKAPGDSRGGYALISFVNNACETHDRQTGHFPSIGRRMP